MKTYFSLSGLVALSMAPALASTTSTPRELHLRADLDADGRLDIAVINRADGSFRIGYQQAPGVMTWSQGRASGAPGASWATSGALLGANGVLAISAEESNLVSLCEAPFPNSTVKPAIIHSAGLGPAGVVAVDVGGAGNTADDDLLVMTRLNDLPTQNRVDLIRHTGGGVESFSAINQVSGSAFLAGDRVVVKEGDGPLVAVLGGGELSAVLRLFDLSSGSVVEKASVAGLPGSGFVSGRFGGGDYHQFFMWHRDDSLVQWRPTALAGGNGVQFLAGGSFDAGMPVGEIVVLSGGVAERLLVISSDGSKAMVFDFDGVNASEVGSFSAPEGSDFTGAFAREGGALTLLSGTPGSGVSAHSHEWQTDGSGYAEGASSELPGHRPAGTRANIFLFASEPFVVPDPGLLGKLNAPEWSSEVNVNGNPASVSATTESFNGSSSGLGGASPTALGSAPDGAGFALGNQMLPETSLGSFQNLLGSGDLKVSISPASGTYSVAVSPVVSASSPVAQVFARVGQGNWTAIDQFHPRLTSDAQVQFYALSADGLRKSPIRSASYTFSVAPNLIDSDQDGVPDFVEATAVPPANQIPPLDPNSGGDVDQDGFSDFEEWLAGTNPLDPNDHPENHIANGGSFIVRAVPRPIDGTTGLPSVSAADVQGEVRTPEGVHLGSNATRLDVSGFVGTPAIEVSGLRSASPLASVLSQPVFDIATIDAEKKRGRELGALFAVPRVPLPSINYVPGGGTTAQEVAAWKTAAQASLNASQPPVVALQPDEDDVLVALLFERWLNGVALARALPEVTASNVTVFPSRAGEVGARALTPEEMSALSVHLGDALPGWNVVTVLETLGGADLDSLEAVATDIYRISSLLGVGENAPDYLPPLDVLRDFVRTGNLPPAYEAASNLSAPDRATAFQSIAPLLATLSPRSVETMELLVTSGTFSGSCPVLDRVGEVGQVSLLQALGVPFNFPDTFTLVPGARVLVTGHTDIDDPDCPGDDMVVLSISVVHLPVPAGVDVDNNLLDDEWECFFLGGGNPLDDSDGDGFSNLQELLDGTDPLLPESKGNAPADLSPPQLKIAQNDADELVIEWDYPANYSGDVLFEVLCGDNLIQFAPVNVDPVVDDGHFTVTIPLSGDEKKFYQVRLSLAH